MSVRSTGVKIPKTIGTSQLTDAFGKITLSSEVRDFLATLGARLVVTYSSGSDKPDLEIVDKRGHNVCSIDEFVKLGGFRRWVNDELKALEKNNAGSEKVNLIALFYRKAGEKMLTLPERMDEGNETKFRQFHSMVKQVVDHVDAIEETIDSDAKTYLLGKAKLLVGVLYKLMLDCMEAERVGKSAYSDAIFSRGIPRWIANKFTDKQFTSNLKADALVLLFPKGNYTKSIALTSKEMESEPFLAANRFVVEKSGSIIALANTDWKHLGLIPEVPKPLEKEVQSFMDGFMWTLISPYGIPELLEIRASGKSIPSFKARQKPNPRPGSKTRPETETQRICREIHNKLGELVVTWLHFANLVVPCANPVDDFWSKILSGTDAWEITPTHGIYDCIKDEIDAEQKLASLRALDNKTLLKLMAEVVTYTIRIPTSSDTGKKILEIFAAMENRADFKEMSKPLDTLDSKYDIDVSTMKKVDIPTEVLENTKKFLGVSAKKKKKTSRRGGPASVRLHSQVLTELSILEGKEIYPRIKEWIGSTFKTGQNSKTQLLAAQLIAGEVLRYQDELLDEDFDEFNYLEELEEAEED